MTLLLDSCPVSQTVMQLQPSFVFAPGAKWCIPFARPENRLVEIAANALNQDIENGVENLPHIDFADDHRVSPLESSH